MTLTPTPKTSTGGEATIASPLALASAAGVGIGIEGMFAQILAAVERSVRLVTVLNRFYWFILLGRT